MKILGYHTATNALATSEGWVCTQPPYLDFLLEQSDPDVIQVMYHLDYNVAQLLKMIGLTEYEGKKLLDKGRLYLVPYTLHYIPGKFFSIDKGFGKGHPFATFSNMAQYFEAKIAPVGLDTGLVWMASKAASIGQEVYDTLTSLGLHPTTLVSPVRAYQKEVLSKLDLPTVNDIPAETGEWAYECCRGAWLEAFKKGHWELAWDYDISSGYPYQATQLPDIRQGVWVHRASRPEWPDKAALGYCRGIVTITAEFSPILYKAADMSYTPTGTWSTILTMAEIDFIDKYNLGHFELEDGWWWIPMGNDSVIGYPLRNPMHQLYDEKEAATGLRRGVIKRIMCFSPDTNIWTEAGIRNVKDIEAGNRAYSINPETGEVELKTITATQEYPYSGNMIHFQNKKHDFLVTQEHQFLWKKDSRQHYEWFFAKDVLPYGQGVSWAFPEFKPISGKKQSELSLWKYLEPNDVIAVQPNRKHASTFEKDKCFRFIGNGRGYVTQQQHIEDPEIFELEKDCKLYIKGSIKGWRTKWQYNMDDLLELMGWYISEGCTWREKNGNSKGISITVKAYNSIKEVCSLLDRMGIRYHSASDGADIASTPLYQFFSQDCGIGAENKHIPKWCFELDNSHLKHLYKTLMEGDGTQGKPRQMDKYTTVSEQLATDFQRLCIHLGLKSRITSNEFRKNGKPLYRVFIYSNKFKSNLWRKDTTLENYSGHVYCITVEDNHTILAGRNNKFEFTGQSGIYGKFLEVRQFEEVEMGPMFNPVWAAEIETNCRLEVARLALENGIVPIHIAVDGLLSDRDLLIASNGTMGQWEMVFSQSTLVAGSGAVAIKDKRGIGDFSLDYDQIMEWIKAHPKERYFEMRKLSPVTLAKAINLGQFDRLGELEETVRTLDLGYEIKRCYLEIVENGQELVDKQLDSMPWDISLLSNEGVTG